MFRYSTGALWYVQNSVICWVMVHLSLCTYYSSNSMRPHRSGGASEAETAWWSHGHSVDLIARPVARMSHSIWNLGFPCSYFGRLVCARGESWEEWARRWEVWGTRCEREARGEIWEERAGRWEVRARGARCEVRGDRYEHEVRAGRCELGSQRCKVKAQSVRWEREVRSENTSCEMRARGARCGLRWIARCELRWASYQVWAARCDSLDLQQLSC
jgi:hypothetical protein